MGNKDKDGPRIRDLTKYTGDPRDSIMILTVTVLVFIVALAWRDTANRAFNEYFPDGVGIVQAQFWYALIATIITIIVIYIMSKMR